MTANHVPSAIWSTATWAACFAASRFGPFIEPDVSMMTISATPPPLAGAEPAPVLVTVTIACTSVAPSERNSFWNTSVRNSATVAPRRSAVGVCGNRHRRRLEIIERRLHPGERGGDVVAAALRVGPAHELAGHRVRRRADVRGRALQERAQVRRFRGVVPEPVRADEHPAGSPGPGRSGARDDPLG